MATYPSPVTVAELQYYLRDSSVDPALLSFYQGLLDTSTEGVYTWLDRDYTAAAVKTETFIGGDTLWHFTQHPVGSIMSWETSDAFGTTESRDVSELQIRLQGQAIQCVSDIFSSLLEHTITYKQPATVTCPEAVRQIITELAAQYFNESKQGIGALGLSTISTYEDLNHERATFAPLASRHVSKLLPYRRMTN